jgi:hypothetical protein
MIRIMSKKCLQEPAHSVSEAIETMDIETWARDAEGGQLPPESARAFAQWLNSQWNDFTDDEEATVGDVLNGAVSSWCGGRSF